MIEKKNKKYLANLLTYPHICHICVLVFQIIKQIDGIPLMVNSVCLYIYIEICQLMNDTEMTLTFDPQNSCVRPCFKMHQRCKFVKIQSSNFKTLR